jgi:hypothetical protein
MQWLISRANRASFPARFFSSRFADLVPFAWSLWRRRSCRLRYRFTVRPAMICPSLVVAMFALPRSTPRNPSGS